VTCYNSSEAKGHRERSRKRIQGLQQGLEAVGDAEEKSNTKAVRALRPHSAMGRYVNELPGGKPRIDLWREDRLRSHVLLC